MIDFDETTPPPKATVLRVASRYTWDEVERVYGAAVRQKHDPNYVPPALLGERTPVGDLQPGQHFIHNTMVFRVSGRSYVGSKYVRTGSARPKRHDVMMYEAEYVGDVVGFDLAPLMFGGTMRVVEFAESMAVTPYTPPSDE